jgi:hypothetical protein
MFDPMNWKRPRHGSERGQKPERSLGRSGASTSALYAPQKQPQKQVQRRVLEQALERVTQKA